MLDELALCLVDERKMSRKLSSTPSPLGFRLQVSGTGIAMVKTGDRP